MPAVLYLCLHLCDFAAQAIVRSRPELRHHPLAVVSGTPPLEFVFGLNQRARSLGLDLGMTRIQAESFPGMAVLRRDRAQEEAAFAELAAHAHRFSPRVQAIVAPEETSSGATLVLDIANSERLFGTPKQIAEALLKDVRAAGCEANIAVSQNANAALLAARGRARITVIPSGRETETLSPLPLSVLELDGAQSQTFATWGVHTLGQLAALPLKSLVARIGQDGHRLHLIARGAYDHLLVPEEAPADAPLVERVELEHPVELLEPLLFLLSRTLEDLTRRAAERALAIASVETCLVLDDAKQPKHRRAIRPAFPERDHHTLLKLIQLDLELHPPQAPVAAFELCVQPARRQKVQQGLFAPQSPEAGRLEVLMARLRKLVGEERVGAPELLDSHDPEAFRMVPFVSDGDSRPQPSSPHRLRTSAVRMVRPPLAVRIGMNGTAPATLFLEGQRFAVQTHSGPWRTSGAWWTNSNWCREEWDIAVEGPQRRCLRLAYDPGANCWYLIGIYD